MNQKIFQLAKIHEIESEGESENEEDSETHPKQPDHLQLLIIDSNPMAQAFEFMAIADGDSELKINCGVSVCQ